MARPRIRAVLVATTLALSSVVALGAAAPASARSANPAWNVPITSAYSNTTWYFGHTSCQRAPGASACENAVVRALDHARTALGQRAYRLPARFDSLTSAEQLLVLVNDDRALYGLPRVLGLNASLDVAATTGAKADADPAPVGHSWVAAASNWAGGMASPLFAYYGWMYDDGLNRNGTSSNLDCTSAHPSGCWSHRDNVLLDFGAASLPLLGVGRAGATRYGPSWTQLFQAYPRGTRLGYIPTVTGLSSYRGGVAGNSVMHISGYGFIGVRSVQFGNTVAKISRRSGTGLDVVVPRHSKGVVYVRATTTGGHSNPTGAAIYTYR